MSSIAPFDAFAVAAEISTASAMPPLVPAGNVMAVSLGPRGNVVLHLSGSDLLAIARTTMEQHREGLTIDFGEALHVRFFGNAVKARQRAGRVVRLSADGYGLRADEVLWSRATAQMIDANEYRYVVAVLDREGGERPGLSVASVSLWNDPGAFGLVALSAQPLRTVSAHLTPDLPPGARVKLERELAMRQAAALADAARSLMAAQERSGGTLSSAQAVRMVQRQSGL